MNKTDVITSYSIHYTKLYEAFQVELLERVGQHRDPEAILAIRELASYNFV